MCRLVSFWRESQVFHPSTHSSESSHSFHPRKTASVCSFVCSRETEAWRSSLFHLWNTILRILVIILDGYIHRRFTHHELLSERWHFWSHFSLCRIPTTTFDSREVVLHLSCSSIQASPRLILAAPRYTSVHLNLRFSRSVEGLKRLQNRICDHTTSH